MLNVRCFFQISLLFLFTTTAFAGLPQPMCVYYGQAVDGYGWPYSTNAQVVLLHGTNEVARHTITGSLSPGVNFALYVHLDSGTTATDYSPRALRSGDLVSIVVRDQAGEKTIMEQQAIPPVGAPGEVIMIDATAADDADGDQLPDQWEQELVNWSYGSLGGIEDVNPGDDFDGDGQSNGDEYAAGTFAFLDYDLFYAEDFARTTNGRFRISFLSVPGKLYGVRYVTAMNQSLWTPAPSASSDTAEFQTVAIEGTGDWLSIYLPGDLTAAFFRPTVESAGSYQLTATTTSTASLAMDNAGNNPYPASQFQPGDNGGVNFEPWMKLESSALPGSMYLGPGIGGSAHSWGLSGTHAVGRALPGVAYRGLWQIRMVHGANNTGFSGFNLKTAALAGFDAGEIIRVGLPSDLNGFDNGGVYVSTDGGNTYDFLDCGWVNGLGDRLIYQILWDETGSYTLTVVNTDENTMAQFTGMLPSSAVAMLGVAVFGNTLEETVQFDSLAYLNAPVLSIQPVGDSVVLSWLSGFAGYNLQSTTDLTAPDWQPVGQSVFSVNGMNQVTVPVSETQQFFRLSQ